MSMTMATAKAMTIAMVMAMAMTYVGEKLLDSRNTHLMTSDGERKQGEEGDCMAMVTAMKLQ